MMKSALNIAIITLITMSIGCSSSSVKNDMTPKEAKQESAQYIDKSIVNFGVNSYEITPEQKERLDRILEKLQHSGTSYLIKLSGFTDDVGSQEYNDQLAIKRTEMVRDYLVSRMVPENYIVIEAMGKCCYVNNNIDEYDRMNNRRVEITYMNEFSVVDFERNNLASVMQELSSKHSDKQFIVMANSQYTSYDYEVQIGKTMEALRSNLLPVSDAQKLILPYGPSVVLIVADGSHQVLADEFPVYEYFGNSKEEIAFNGTQYVIREKQKRLVPARRTEQEVRRILQSIDTPKMGESMATEPAKSTGQSDKLSYRLNQYQTIE